MNFPLGDKPNTRSGSYYLPFSTYRVIGSQRSWREGIAFETMNTRLQIASGVLAGAMSAPNQAIQSDGAAIAWALQLADDLILAEEATRKAEEPKNTVVDDSRLASEIRTFIRELEQGKAPGVAVSYVIQELRIMLERANARREL